LPLPGLLGILSCIVCKAPPDKPPTCDAFTPLGLHCQEYAAWYNHRRDSYLCEYHYRVYRKQSAPRHTGFRKLRVRVS
jgi:hypothetical protein